MRMFLAAVGLLAISTPVLAQTAPSDTLVAATTNGMVISLPQGDVDVTYTPDGKFSAANGMVTGTWRIDGTKLCTISSVNPGETCVVYPVGKKPGDSFDVTGPNGTATVKINAAPPAK
jgi:hypothetical protein